MVFDLVEETRYSYTPFKEMNMAQKIETHNLNDVIQSGNLDLITASKYLNIYVGFADWESAIKKLFASPKVSQDKALTKKIISATILLPFDDKSTYIDPEHPENLLLKMPYYQQLGDKDWFADFQKICIADSVIDAHRRSAYALGIVTPFEYSPITRQAYNWLYTKAEDSGATGSDERKKDISERFKNLVTAYGGAVICNVFSRHETSLKKVINWRTGYFFEKVMYEIYTPEQILKIKKSELDSTNEKLVKSVRII